MYLQLVILSHYLESSLSLEYLRRVRSPWSLCKDSGNEKQSNEEQFHHRSVVAYDGITGDFVGFLRVSNARCSFYLKTSCESNLANTIQ